MELEHQFEQLQLLYELTQAVNRADEPSEIYRAAVEGLVRAVAADRASVMTFDADGVMRYKAWKGISDHHRATMERPISINWHRGARNVQAITVADVTQDPSLSRLLPAFANEGIRALALIPLLGNGGLIGKFVLYYNAPHEFVTEELQLAQTIATHVAFAAERHLAGELLRESEERLKSSERLAHVGHWSWDAKSKQVIWSEECFRIFGRPPDYQPSYEEFLKAVLPQDRELVERAERERLAAKNGTSIEYRIARPDGDVRIVRSVSEVVLDEEGRPERMFGAVQDITDLRRAQEESFARQKLETLGTLANGIAHDFNNLLGAVLAQADLALAECAAGSSPEEELERIRNAAFRGSEIVRQLMIYAGKEDAGVELVDVSWTVKDMLDLLKVSVSKRAVIETDLVQDLPAVRANGAQIRQIVMNLVTNASEAIGDRDGVIRLTTARVTIGRDAANSKGVTEGDYVQLAVSDTGGGMPVETQARVFDPFFTTKAAGRGIGLAVVQGNVRKLRGAIHLVSEPGKGTMFQILLPSEAGVGATAGPIRGAEEAARLLQEATVLVVEDEDLLRQAVAKMLRKKGFEVLEAANGSTAIDLLRANSDRIDAILLDMTLPGRSSGEVVAEASRLRPDLKVILTSAYSEEMARATLSARKSVVLFASPFS